MSRDVVKQGGREKAPAAFCRKAICSTKDFEMWGDGEQTRSFMFIDDCVEGTIRIMEGDYKLPLNLGTEEMVSCFSNPLGEVCGHKIDRFGFCERTW